MSSEPAREAAVAGLLDDLERAGELRLPALTTDELAALGGLDAWPLVDAGALDWWRGLSEDARSAVEASALRGMIARGLLRQDGVDAGQVTLEPSPELAILLTARRRPSFVAVCTEVDGDQMRLYGAADEESGPRCVVLELVSGLLRDYRLWSPHHAPAALASWACAAPEDAAHEAVRTLDFVTPGAGGPTRSRFSVMATATRVLVSEPDESGTLGPPAPTAPDHMATRLRHLMSGSPLYRKSSLSTTRIPGATASGMGVGPASGASGGVPG
jgi:hypothetical protein